MHYNIANCWSSLVNADGEICPGEWSTTKDQATILLCGIDTERDKSAYATLCLGTEGCQQCFCADDLDELAAFVTALAKQMREPAFLESINAAPTPLTPHTPS